VDKVCNIVKEQLALPDGTAITGESKFAELGADSLDTVIPLLKLTVVQKKKVYI
jgi:acyl carrier protein